MMASRTITTQKKKDLKDQYQVADLESMTLCALILLHTLREGQ